MYLTTINDENVINLTGSQRIVGEMLEQAGYAWGIWYSNDVDDWLYSSSFHWKIVSNASFAEMRAVIRRASIRLAGNFSCPHTEQDCCGCIFLSNFEAALLNGSVDGEKTYVILESYERNI